MPFFIYMVFVVTLDFIHLYIQLVSTYVMHIYTSPVYISAIIYLYYNINDINDIISDV